MCLVVIMPFSMISQFSTGHQWRWISHWFKFEKLTFWVWNWKLKICPIISLYIHLQIKSFQYLQKKKNSNVGQNVVSTSFQWKVSKLWSFLKTPSPVLKISWNTRLCCAKPDGPIILFRCSKFQDKINFSYKDHNNAVSPDGKVRWLHLEVIIISKTVYLSDILGLADFAVRLVDFMFTSLTGKWRFWVTFFEEIN